MSIKTQNYSNHTRFVPSFHILTLGAIGFVFVVAVQNLLRGDNITRVYPWAFVCLTASIISIALYSRSFALKAQDRAIRAEENLRYFILAGKRMSQALSMRQVIALRFASDEEFVELCEKAIRENLSQREIKKSIKNWRPDYHRA